MAYDLLHLPAQSHVLLLLRGELSLQLLDLRLGTCDYLLRLLVRFLHWFIVKAQSQTHLNHRARNYLVIYEEAN